jgi:hypothetical protein
MALGGKESIPDVPIRRGEKSARIILQLDGPDGGLVITRRFTEKDSYIDIKRADGGKVGAPQALLDSLCNRVAFDPLSWIRARPAEQVETLRKLVGLDFRQADKERADLYAKRTEINRTTKQEAAAAEAIPQIDAPAAPVSVADLMAELRRRKDCNRDIDAGKRKRDDIANGMEMLVRRAGEIKQKIETLQAKLADMRAEHARMAQQLTEADGSLSTMQPANESEIEQQIRDSEQINEAIRSNNARRQHEVNAEHFAKQAEQLTAAIDKIDADKSAALAAARWPIPGLSFDGDGIVFNRVPLDQASSAEQTRIAVAIGLALNPKLPVVLIRDGSLLDEASLAAVGQQAAAAGAQVWVERVGRGDECAVVIEDGEVMT